MEKITPSNVLKIIEKVDRRSFLVNPFYLIMNCNVLERNGELLLFLDTDFLLIPPKNPQNMTHKKIWCYAEDVEAIKRAGIAIKSAQPDSTEYFYLTKNYLKLTGKDYKHFRQHVHFFENHYSYRIAEEYSTEAVKDFTRRWHEDNVFKKSPEHREAFDAEFQATLKAIDLLREIPIARALYVEVNGVLEGFAIYAPLYPDFWASIYQKTNNALRGIGHMLFVEKAKRMKDCTYGTKGDDGMDAALAAHKEELRPIRKERYFLVETGGFE